MYTYRARVVRVIDGDTVVLDIDLGFDIHHIKSCRLYGINAYELRDKDPEKKRLATFGKVALTEMLPPVVIIESKDLDKYGRPLVEIHLTDDMERLLDPTSSLSTANLEMLHRRLAVPYLDPKNKLGNTEPYTGL
jgi:micrococcal nuclease